MNADDKVKALRDELRKVLAELEAVSGYDRQDEIRAVLAATDDTINTAQSN